MKLLFCLLLLIPIMAFSQSKFTFSGKVISVQGESIALANITLDKHNKYAVAKEDGSFQINRLNSGDYVVTISAIGFKTINQNITINSNMRMEFVMREEVQNLKDVTVVGKTEAREISEKAITISSLDVKIVADQALGAEEVLKTSTGIVVRQNGGLGSSFNINLNGLTGQAVRIYYDGIPVQVFGGGIQLNNIPVDALERIDVYKGVIPIDIGTDALGGGINLVPLQLEGNYLRTSYSVGSFNTHRFTFNGQKSFNESIAVSVLSYFNYSDNDYSMSNIPNLVETLLPDGSVGGVTEERIDTRRFHDQHTSAYIEGALKIKNVSWADRLELTSSFSHRFDEIQQGTFIINTSVGEAEREVNTFAQRLNYKKKLF
ncbi:MAG: carboxypeptidase-like regulatory domain-containing protein, partial [Bacteroidota bacterium]